MIDLHHHLLFGLDDGSPDLTTSVAMARLAVEDGITHVVCTPHASGRYAYQPAVNAERIALLRQALSEEGVPLTLGLGCDFHLSYDNIEDALANPGKYAINGTNYLLIELPDFGIPRSLGESFYEMRRVGITPILTHPERNPTLQRERERLDDWMRAGLLLQVTAASVLGNMGKIAQQMSERLLADRWVHVLATDAHNLTSRPPRMREARELVARRHGRDYAELITTANPKAIFDGVPLGAQQPMLNLFPQNPDDDHDSKPAWWKRLLRRRPGS